MTVLEKLKEKSLKLRKDKDPLAAKIMFAISEIEKVGKDKRNGPATDEEAIKTIRKIVENIDNSIKVLPSLSPRTLSLDREKRLLLSVVPSTIPEAETKTIILTMVAQNAGVVDKPAIMKYFKATFGSRADLKLVATLLNDLYGV